MGEGDLTPEELELVRRHVEIGPGLEADRQDVWRAQLAKDTGGRYRKLGPGTYEIIATAPREPD